MDTPSAVAREHLAAWRRCGLSLRDMVGAFGVECPTIIGEDDVLLLLERAWLTVRREKGAERPVDVDALPEPATDVLRLPDPMSMRRPARRVA